MKRKRKNKSGHFKEPCENCNPNFPFRRCQKCQEDRINLLRTQLLSFPLELLRIVEEYWDIENKPIYTQKEFKLIWTHLEGKKHIDVKQVIQRFTDQFLYPSSGLEFAASKRLYPFTLIDVQTVISFLSEEIDDREEEDIPWAGLEFIRNRRCLYMAYIRLLTGTEQQRNRLVDTYGTYGYGEISNIVRGIYWASQDLNKHK